MRAVIQRVSYAKVTVEGEVISTIGNGMLVLLGIAHNDQLSDVDYLVSKLIALRIFSDEQGKMNLNIQAANGSFLVVSQFTLYAHTQKGNRPSFIDAAKPEVALPLYHAFIDRLSTQSGKTIHTGKFGADMKLELVNDGPVTIILDSN